jgi:hypothetical protein
MSRRLHDAAAAAQTQVCYLGEDEHPGAVEPTRAILTAYSMAEAQKKPEQRKPTRTSRNNFDRYSYLRVEAPGVWSEVAVNSFAAETCTCVAELES